MRVVVLLSCGHWFQEHRPDRVKPPEQGERRACGSLDHYPKQYPATYISWDSVYGDQDDYPPVISDRSVY